MCRIDPSTEVPGILLMLLHGEEKKKPLDSKTRKEKENMTHA